MRIPAMLLVTVAACAPRASRIPEVPRDATFACSAHPLQLRHGRAFAAHELALGWIDRDGDHFIERTPGEDRAVEYVVPADPRNDAMERTYDTSQASSRSDWRLVQTSTCVARGGYSDALARYAAGASFTTVAHDLALSDEAEARALVHHAIRGLESRYRAD